MSGLKVIFMGTPDFAVPALEAILGAGHKVVGVYSQPPRPSGRGEKIKKSPVHECAENHGLTVVTPKGLRSDEATQMFKDHGADIGVVVAYGLILPAPILQAPPLGCLNIHGSLLPRWRGAAPIQRAIEAGDKETGITIMQMDEGLDTGHMLLKDSLPIGHTTTAQALHDDLSRMGARMIVEVLAQAQKGSIQGIPQPEEGITYAAKLQKSESVVDWTQSAEEIERKGRAFTPWPGLGFCLNKKRIKILEASVEEGLGVPGEFIDNRLAIACGQGVLRILRLQKEGKAPMTAESFLNGMPIPKGSKVDP